MAVEMQQMQQPLQQQQQIQPHQQQHHLKEKQTLRPIKKNAGAVQRRASALKAQYHHAMSCHQDILSCLAKDQDWVALRSDENEASLKSLFETLQNTIAQNSFHREFLRHDLTLVRRRNSKTPADWIVLLDTMEKALKPGLDAITAQHLKFQKMAMAGKQATQCEASSDAAPIGDASSSKRARKARAQ